MDLYKLKWKLNFRKDQVIAFFKLMKYEFRHKFHLEGDDQFYYHLQRGLMKGLLKDTPEHAFLEEHGLLPEPEPEPEREPGLIREVHMVNLAHRSLECKGGTFFPTGMKEYEDHIWLEIAWVFDFDVTYHEICKEQPAGERYTEFTLEGVDLRFDNENLRLMLV